MLPDDPLQGDPLEVRVRGERFTGWKSVEVLRPLDAATGAFDLKFGPDLARGLPLKPGDKVELFVGGEKLLDGYCDAIRADTESQDDGATGRDRTADLVDSTVEKQHTFPPLISTLGLVVGLIAREFGIPVRGDSERSFTQLFDFATTPGETAWTAIDRAARIAGVMVYTDGSGAIVLTDPGAGGAAAVELVQGEGGNVLGATLEVDHTERFDTYIVRGQRTGSDFDFGASVALVEGVATDPSVGRRRPLVIVAEGAVTNEEAAARAQWEAVRRAARAQRVSVTVRDWTQGPNGPLWKPNQLVRTRIPRLGIDAELLVNRVRMKRAKDGTSCRLELVRRDAFTLQPEVEPVDPFFGEDE